MIEEYTDPLIKLMEKAVIVSAFMLVLGYSLRVYN